MTACRNIRFAFFQPASRELLTILHFHLIDPIMVGKRKTDYVQFYTEISDIIQSVEGGRRSAFDPDEIEEEVREKERVQKVRPHHSHQPPGTDVCLLDQSRIPGFCEESPGALVSRIFRSESGI